MGSGLRAAAILSHLHHGVAQLHTRLDEQSADEANAMAAMFGVELIGRSRPYPIEYSYYTPLSAPVQTTPPHLTDVLTVEASAVVAFGMAEGPWNVTADAAVVDLQHATPESSGLLASTIERLALVLNENEMRRLAGGHGPAEITSLMASLNAEVIVVKRGIRGATVASAAGLSQVGAHPTLAIHPVGSGDAFTAGFATRWLNGESPTDAAAFGSKIAAAYCQSGDPMIRQSQLDLLQAACVVTNSAQVYLAGPFFNLAERWLIDHVRDALRGLGMSPFSPLHEVGFGGDEVAIPDINGLEASGSVLALLDHGDAGTIFEVGWARARDIPVVAYAEIPHAAEWTMLRGTGCEIHSDLATAIYRAGWAATRNQ